MVFPLELVIHIREDTRLLLCLPQGGKSGPQIHVCLTLEVSDPALLRPSPRLRAFSLANAFACQSQGPCTKVCLGDHKGYSHLQTTGTLSPGSGMALVLFSHQSYNLETACSIPFPDLILRLGVGKNKLRKDLFKTIGEADSPVTCSGHV